ncbi:MAG: ABC transporter ATP-binding protein [Christensenellales bacterium]
MLELKNISAGYENNPVLDGVTASFERGKLTSIIGVNGCGKSTLLKVMLGILPVSRGEVVIDGQNLSSMNRNEIAHKVAYLAQGKNTPDMTVEQMVLHGRFPYLSYPRRYKESDREYAKKAMDAVGISHLAKKPLYALSGGMRQNAYIAMALAQDTDYILLDEPTTYLDVSHQLELMRLLKKLADAGKGIVTVTHDLSLAFNFSDEIAVIQKGAVVAHATPSEICRSSVIHEIFAVKMEIIDNNFYCKY